MFFVRNKFLSLVFLQAAVLVTVVLSAIPATVLADEVELLNSGDQAMYMGKFSKAEAAYGQALKNNPHNYRIRFSLAQAKTKLKKYKEAESLLEEILAMPVTQRNDVMVFYPGQSEGEEAELVDAIVIPPQRTKNNMRNYVDVKGNAPIPQYRLFFKKKNMMQLVPQKTVRLEYKSVLRSMHKEAQLLYNDVRKELIPGSVDGVEIISLKGGCFMMGSDKGAVRETPVHEVCLSPFKIDKTEVTQAHFQSVMGTNPSDHVAGNLPVDSATWWEADQYCKKSGKRLPTEAEWEYAARAGKTTNFYWGDKLKGGEANFCDKNCGLNVRVAVVDDGYATTAPVGKFPPNPHGLYDMAGNLAEWVSDWMDGAYYRISPKKDPKGPRPQRLKVVRGGAWNTDAGKMRSSARSFFDPDIRNLGVGFRCASSS